MTLPDHLGPDEHGPVGPRESLEGVAQLLRLLDRVGVETDHLELRHLRGQRALELLRPHTDACKLRRTARGTGLPHRFHAPAVMAAERRVPRAADGSPFPGPRAGGFAAGACSRMQRESDVAER